MSPAAVDSCYQTEHFSVHEPNPIDLCSQTEHFSFGEPAPLIHVTKLNIFNFMMSQPGAKHMSVCRMSIYGSYHRWLLAMYHRYIIVELLSLWDILFMHCLPIQAQLSAALHQW